MLDTIQRGRKLKPLAMLVYGVHGIGKSTFPTEAPFPIYIGAEENDEIDADRFPKIEKWSQLISQLTSLLNDKHNYKTLVVDTVDSLEFIAQKEILGKHPGKSMETALGGYGKAYKKMAEMFLDLRDNYIVPLRDSKGMNIVLLSHADKVKHEDPMTNTTYDHYMTSMDKRIKPLFEDWVSMILFANFYLVKAERADGKEYAAGADGLRMFFTEERPAHVAKNRFNLPYEIEFHKNGTWKKLAALIVDHYKVDGTIQMAEQKKIEEVKQQSQTLDKINEKLPLISNDLKLSIETAIVRANGDEKELQRILTKMEKAIE